LTIGERALIVVINDERRRFLYQGLAAGLGADVANALMEHLPPEGWSGLATRSDLDRTAAELRAELSQLAAQLRAEMAAQTRTLMIGLVGSVTTAVAATAALGH
jgi:hypothetical protein